MPTTEPNEALFEDDSDAALDHLRALLAAELEALDEILPAVYSAQWAASPVPKPRDDTTQRASGGHGDPTQSITIDERRSALRDQVSRSTYHARIALLRLRGVRRGLEITLARWEGEDH